MIVDERIVTFINSLDTKNSEILEKIESEARAADVPDSTSIIFRISSGSCRPGAALSLIM